MSDLSGLKRLPPGVHQIHYNASGRVAVLKKLTLHWLSQPDPLCLDDVVLDTGQDIALLIPLRLIRDAAYPEYSRYHKDVKGINGGVLKCDIFFGTVGLGGDHHEVEVWVSEDAPSAVIGLEVLKKYHLMLAENDPCVPWGPCLLKCPLTQHGLTQAKVK